MNWDALSFDWNQIRAFLATAETGSFSGAARALRSTQPTVGRQVAALEESLGLVLVERSGRGLMLTQAGRDLLEQVRKMGDAALNISLVADGQSNALSGKVREYFVECIHSRNTQGDRIKGRPLTPLEKQDVDLSMDVWGKFHKNLHCVCQGVSQPLALTQP